MKDKRIKIKLHYHQHIADVFSCIPLHPFNRSVKAAVDNKIFINDRRFRLVNIDRTGLSTTLLVH
jgi:hypothetical protein